MNAPPTVETERLLLRAPEVADVDDLFQIQGNREAMRHTYVAPDRDATARYVQAYAARFSEDGFAPWTAVLRSENRVIGWGGLNKDPQAPQWGTEVAYFIHPAYCGRGFATGLVLAALQLAFRDLGLTDVFAFTRPENHASQRVLEKAGFAFVRHVPELERDQYVVRPGMREGALGLKYGTVRLVEHDTRWGQAFLTERAALVAALDGLGCEVEHVGSTAVPGLPAKPILDIAVGIPQLSDLSECIVRLERLGYEYRGDADHEGGHVFVRANGDVRTHHVHVVTLEETQWRAYLALRDLLRHDPVARAMYAAAKRELALRFVDDRKSYMKGKDEVVDRLLRQAASRRGRAST